MVFGLSWWLACMPACWRLWARDRWALQRGNLWPIPSEPCCCAFCLSIYLYFCTRLELFLSSHSTLSSTYFVSRFIHLLRCRWSTITSTEETVPVFWVCLIKTLPSFVWCTILFSLLFWGRLFDEREHCLTFSCTVWPLICWSEWGDQVYRLFSFSFFPPASPTFRYFQWDIFFPI